MASSLVTGIVAGKGAYQGERALVSPLLASVQPGQWWIAERHYRWSLSIALD